MAGFRSWGSVLIPLPPTCPDRTMEAVTTRVGISGRDMNRVCTKVNEAHVTILNSIVVLASQRLIGWALP